MKVKAIIGRRLGRVLHSSSAPLIVALTFVTAYIIIYGLVSISRINHFDGVSGYDLSIPDQGIWLMSQLKNPFSTIRGLHLFGDHTPYVYILFVPVYWIWPDIRVLLFLHTAALAVGGLGVFLIARHVFSGGARSLVDNWAPAAFTLVYLLYPALNFLNMDLIFSESFAVPLIIFAFYFLLKSRYGLFQILCALALLCKEDAAATVFMLGLYAAVFHERKHGLIVCAMAVFWFGLNMGFLLKYFNGFGYFRHLYGYNALGRLGPTAYDAVQKVNAQPSLLQEILYTLDNRNYVLDIFSPVIFLPVLAPTVLLLCLPALGVNLISGYYYTHFIRYHYTAYLIPFIIISTIYGVRFFQHFRLTASGRSVSAVVPIILLLLCVEVLMSQTIGGELNIIKNPKGVISLAADYRTYDNHVLVMLGAVSALPPEASVSATYNMLTHIAHRDKVYMFTSPFKPAYWGINGENLPPEKPQYLLLDTPLLDKDGRAIVDAYVNNGTYSLISKEDGIITLKRN